MKGQRTRPRTVRGKPRRSRATLGIMKLLKSSFICFAGLLVAVLLYIAANILIIMPMQQRSGRAPEDFVPFAFQIVLTICLFIGSITSGCLSKKYADISNVFIRILISPGIYASVLVLYGAFAHETIPWYRHFILVTSIIWVITSFAGIMLGYILIKKPNKAPSGNPAPPSS